MKWEKLGLIFSPNQNFSWMLTHAANPFVEKIGDALFKVFFTCRDKNNRSHIGYVIIDFDDHFKLLEISSKPVLEPGKIGLFDDSGVAMGCLINFGGRKLLYYLGWNLKITVPWLNAIGLAIYDEDAKAFTKVSRAPIMDRSNEDPFSISYPSIMEEDGKLKMWYGSNLSWGADKENMDHVIKYAESFDGLNWKRSNKVVLDLEHENEYAISNPFIVKNNDKYHLWYSYRGNGDVSTYRIGVAISDDCANWKRIDHLAGINVSKLGWDSEMIEYPYLFTYNGSTYMLYNGNGYGSTGFGLAVLVEK